jgi:hypothetical protein
VIEPDRQQPPSGHVLDTAMATAGTQVLIQVADRLGQTDMMRPEDRPASRRIPGAVEDDTLLVGRRTTSKAGTALRPWGRPSSSPVVGSRPSNMAWNAAGDASPSSPRLAAPAPYQRPG